MLSMWKQHNIKCEAVAEQNGARIECGIMKNLHTSFDEKHKHLYNHKQPSTSELESITFIIIFCCNLTIYYFSLYHTLLLFFFTQYKFKLFFPLDVIFFSLFRNWLKCQFFFVHHWRQNLLTLEFVTVNFSTKKKRIAHKINLNACRSLGNLRMSLKWASRSVLIRILN